MTTVIRAENLGKKYLIRHGQQGQRFRYDSLGESLASGGKALCRKLLHPFSSHSKIPAQEEFWALKDITMKSSKATGLGSKDGMGQANRPC